MILDINVFLNFCSTLLEENKTDKMNESHAKLCFLKVKKLENFFFKGRFTTFGHKKHHVFGVLF